MDGLLRAAHDAYQTAHNAVLKATIEQLNTLELVGFAQIQKSVDVPVRPLSEDENRHAQWQYATQQRVQETPARILEYLYSPVGPETIALTTLLKTWHTGSLAPKAQTLDATSPRISPNGEDRWETQAQEAADWVPRTLHGTPPSRQDLRGHEFLSFHGLAWLFSARLGCYYLRPWTNRTDEDEDGNPRPVGLMASFDQLTRYALKPNMCEARTVRVYFEARQVSRARANAKPRDARPRANCKRVVSHGHWAPTKATEEEEAKETDAGDESAACNDDAPLMRLYVVRILYGDDVCIESEQHPLFVTACRTLMMLALSDASIRYHAILSHMLTGDVFSCATVRALPLTHALRPLVQCLTHKVFDMNNAYRLIVPEPHGTLHTLFPYAWEGGLEKYMADIYADYRIMKDSWAPWAEPTALLRQDAYVDMAAPCVGVVEDMHDLWDLFVRYVSDYLRAVGLDSNASVRADAAVQEWVNQVALQQPNDASKHELEAMWKAQPQVCLHRLLVMFFFHSAVTHDTSSTTERLVASTYAISTHLYDTPDGANPDMVLAGIQTARRAMVSAHATSMVVPLLAQRWGDIMLPAVDATLVHPMALAKQVLNSLPARLSALEVDVRARNKLRYFVSDCILPTELACSIST
jgi:hypothetical protein